MQPPSGGCVLKPLIACPTDAPTLAAAFGRLCVETQLTAFSRPETFCSRLRAAVC